MTAPVLSPLSLKGKSFSVVLRSGLFTMAKNYSNGRVAAAAAAAAALAHYRVFKVVVFFPLRNLSRE